jgi:hypothetical protein
MAKVKVIVTDDPEADIGGAARAALSATRFRVPGDRVGPLSIEITDAHLASRTPVEQVGDQLDLHLPRWRECLSVVADDQ